MDIPLVDLKKNYETIKNEVNEAILQTISTCYFVNGTDVNKFESEFAKYTGSRYCQSCNSGTDALYLAFKSLNIGEGDEVIVQSNTFIASALAVSNVGAKPILVDNDDNFMIDCEEIKRKITAKTKALLVVHLYGLCPNMDEIMEIVKENNLYLIEDCAQASGTYYKNQHVGTFGDLGCFSFYPGKNLGAYGDGGAVITNNEKYNDYIKGWKNWGCGKKKYFHETKGGNSRLDSIQASVLSVKLKYLETWNESRRNIANKYCELLQNTGDIELPNYHEFCKPSWHLFVIKTSKRDELLEYMKTNKVFCGIHYPIPIHKLEAYSEYNSMYLKNVENDSNKIISLPIFPELTLVEIESICGLIKTFYGDNKDI
jgi:dTDP-4-amino-4,6-dideoxygalactose transaminase